MLNLEMKNYLETTLDLIIERVLKISDYYIVEKHLSVSEGACFSFMAVQALWFALFGLTNANFEYYFSATLWTSVVAGITGAHFVSLFFRDPRFRSCVIAIEGVVWCFLVILGAFSRTSAAVPRLAVMVVLCILVAVRLFRNGTYEH